MKTIQEAVESTIRKTPFIEEALNEKANQCIFFS